MSTSTADMGGEPRRRSDGKPGKPRSDGKTGKPRSDGKSGKPRSDGKPGKPRSDGKPGKPRSDGKPGKPRGGDERREGSDRARAGRKPQAGSDRPRGPRIPDDITGAEIDRRVAAELRTLPEALAEKVARLLVATSVALDADEPEQALAFAQEAKRLAGRVSVVREALGLAAYAAGDYAEALSELRAVRRLTGSQDHLPLMADCERGLGRPRKALELLAEVPEEQLPEASRVEARIVAAGARRDLGQADAALLLLQVPALNARRTEPWLPRLRYAYADTLLDLGRVDDARTWFGRAADADLEEQTDAAERVAEIDGVVFGDDWTDDSEEASVAVEGVALKDESGENSASN
ncbi:MAG: hypothetical protein VW362_06670 [Candidatus Nanopelagicales bacterium]